MNPNMLHAHSLISGLNAGPGQGMIAVDLDAAVTESVEIPLEMRFSSVLEAKFGQSGQPLAESFPFSPTDLSSQPVGQSVSAAKPQPPTGKPMPLVGEELPLASRSAVSHEALLATLPMPQLEPSRQSLKSAAVIDQAINVPVVPSSTDLREVLRQPHSEPLPQDVNSAETMAKPLLDQPKGDREKGRHFAATGSATVPAAEKAGETADPVALRAPPLKVAAVTSEDAFTEVETDDVGAQVPVQEAAVLPSAAPSIGNQFEIRPLVSVSQNAVVRRDVADKAAPPDQVKSIETKHDDSTIVIPLPPKPRKSDSPKQEGPVPKTEPVVQSTSHVTSAVSVTSPAATHTMGVPSPASNIATNPASPVPPPEIRPSVDLENAVTQLTEARESGRNLRPEVALKHSEFGVVNMRLEQMAGDLRATLSSRDPGFLPSLQAALPDRALTLGADMGSSASSRGHEGGSTGQPNGGTNSSFGGHSGSAAGQSGHPHYGSSTGSTQASSKPSLDHQASEESDPRSSEHNLTSKGLFA
ncbi:hypothetical protein [Erythrobacter sp. F6033]|uniref:hypothetical protein n=1 Tax=Erythrobacter sp. F6033 TaxID=2926401 RepID=UPI001FF2658D|nr:hypothetical protein [Erythrobacter sp. F6033]MCK0129420.1 hypothetical protein [Erythrobacter sp. F6033]